MKRNEIERFVDSIPMDQHKAGDKRPRFKRSKYLLKGSPLLTILLVIGITSAVLGGMYWSFLQVEMSGTTTLHGKTISSVFEWDGQHILGTLEVPVDVSDLYPGDRINVTHTIANMDLGTWLIHFNDSSLQSIYSNPEHPYYGFNLTMTPDDFTLDPFENMTVTFSYYMHYEMMSPSLYNASENFDYTVSVDVTAITPPLANPDTINVHRSAYGDLYPLTNDIDYSGTGITVVSVTPTVPTSPITLQIMDGGTRIKVTGNSATVGDYTFTYTIRDGNNLEDVGTVTVTIIP